MATVYDVAAYILQVMGKRRVTTMKLQKLVYYSQAWSLAWDDRPLFSEPIEAWDNGPVVRPLWVHHRGARYISTMSRGAPDVLFEEEKRTIRAVVEFYAGRDAEWLSELSHREAPWKNARSGIHGKTQRARIENSALRAYYGEQAKTMAQRKELPKSYANSLELLVSLAPDELDAMYEDSGFSLDDAIAWLETGESGPCATSN